MADTIANEQQARWLASVMQHRKDSQLDAQQLVDLIARIQSCLKSSLYAYHRKKDCSAIANAVCAILCEIPEATYGAATARGVVGVVRAIVKGHFANTTSDVSNNLFLQNLQKGKDLFSSANEMYEQGTEAYHAFIETCSS